MSFNYPKSSFSVTKGKNFYRIKADAVDFSSSNNPKVGPGDLIPVDVGFSTIAIGSESDFDRYELFYPDPVAPSGFQRIEFSKDYPLVGRFDVDNVEAVAGSDGEPSKAFVRPIGLMVKNFANTKVVNAVTDLVVYTGAPPAFLPTRRSDKRREGFVEIAAIAFNDFHMPCFGRRFLGGSIYASFPAGTISYSVFGIRAMYPIESASYPGGNGAGKVAEFAPQTALPPAGVLPTGSIVNIPIAYDCLRDGDGYYDYFMIRIASDTVIKPSDAVGLTPAIRLSMEVRD